MRVLSFVIAVLSAIGVSTLDSIPETTQEPPESYNRDADFGKAWLDVDGNYCDTRNDILGQQLADVEFIPQSEAPSRCRRATVWSGTLDDPYSGRRIEFTRDNPNDVQIDHVVPLSWAWQNGAWQWTQDQRVAFANNPENLIAVDGAANQSKGAKGPSQWMPENSAFHCEYAERFTSVVAGNGLTLPDDDRDALASTLASCTSPVEQHTANEENGPTPVLSGQGSETSPEPDSSAPNPTAGDSTSNSGNTTMAAIRPYLIGAVAVIVLVASVVFPTTGRRRRRGNSRRTGNRRHAGNLRRTSGHRRRI